MDKNEVINTLKDIIIKTLELEIEKEEVKNENLINELQVNSIDAMEILVWIENEYHIEFDDDEINTELMNSLDGLAEKVLSKLSE